MQMCIPRPNLSPLHWSLLLMFSVKELKGFKAALPLYSHGRGKGQRVQALPLQVLLGKVELGAHTPEWNPCLTHIISWTTTITPFYCMQGPLRHGVQIFEKIFLRIFIVLQGNLSPCTSLLPDDICWPISNSRHCALAPLPFLVLSPVLW